MAEIRLLPGARGAFREQLLATLKSDATRGFIVSVGDEDTSPVAVSCAGLSLAEVTYLASMILHMAHTGELAGGGEDGDDGNGSGRRA